jgi:hypothetical protein
MVPDDRGIGDGEPAFPTLLRMLNIDVLLPNLSRFILTMPSCTPPRFNAQPAPATAQFGVGANRRKGGAASFEELQKMAAENMAVGEKKRVAGDGMDLKKKGLDALINDFDPSMLQELLAAELKDPALQEMVSANLRLSCQLFCEGAYVEK